jgi:hypothetical protein
MLTDSVESEISRILQELGQTPLSNLKHSRAQLFRAISYKLGGRFPSPSKVLFILFCE